MSISREYLKARLAEGSLRGQLLLLVLSAIWTSGISKQYASESTEHPFIETKDIKPETCLTCHPAKNQGKFVHTAIALGCQNCHRATSTDYTTVITLNAVGGALCAQCHTTSNNAFQHQPYKAGECLICHNPHTGDYRAQLRAPVNTLCQSCHMLNQPDVRVNAAAGTVSLLDGRTYDLQSYQQAPKIDAGHMASMAAAGADRAKASHTPDAGLNCLSCHQPHSSRTRRLLRKALRGQSALEHSCGKNWCANLAAPGGSRRVAVGQCGPLGRRV